MRSIIATLVGLSSILLGTGALVRAQEVPETFLVTSDRLQHARSPDDFNQYAGGLYNNRMPNCAVLGRQIYPCG